MCFHDCMLMVQSVGSSDTTGLRIRGVCVPAMVSLQHCKVRACGTKVYKSAHPCHSTPLPSFPMPTTGFKLLQYEVSNVDRYRFR